MFIELKEALMKEVRTLKDSLGRDIRADLRNVAVWTSMDFMNSQFKQIKKETGHGFKGNKKRTGKPSSKK